MRRLRFRLPALGALRSHRRSLDLALLGGAVLVLWGPGLSLSRGSRPNLELHSTPVSVAQEPALHCSPDRFARLEEVYKEDYLSLEVTITGYSSCPSQTDDTPNITAVNTRAREGVIALSQDLLRQFTPGAPFSFHDRVEIQGLGTFMVEDTMHRRWRRRADIWFPSRGDAVRWGRRTRTLYRVGNRDDAVAYLQPAPDAVAASFGDARFQ